MKGAHTYFRAGANLLAAAAMLYALAMLALLAIHRLAPQPAGVLGLTAVFEPYLFAPAPVLLALVWRRFRPRVLLAACCATGALLYVPEMLSWPAQADARGAQIHVATWNLFIDNRQTRALPDAILGTQASVVAVQELGGPHYQALARDARIAARYPYRIWQVRDVGVFGMGLLSEYPMPEQGKLDFPPTLWAELDLGGGRSLRVVNTHPMPATAGLQRWGPWVLPTAFDPSRRDRSITALRALIAPWLAAGERVLLVGDFNLTEREPVYRELAAGLQDAQLHAGFGTGLTWGPAFDGFENLPLLRIDYMFAGPGVVPLHSWPDCTPRGSDHCALHGEFELQP